MDNHNKISNLYPHERLPRGLRQAASSALAAHLNQEQIDAGQQWASQLFEHLRAEYQERVSVEMWGWKDDWPRDFIHLQIRDDDKIYLIPIQAADMFVRLCGA